MSLLEVRDLHVAYGELEVVRGVSFSVEPGEIVTVLGSNGAGKTTMLRSLVGLIRPTAGGIQFAGRNICGLPAYDIANRGLALVPEGRQLFPEHTVRENLELGAYRTLRNGKQEEFGKNLADIFELFPRIRERLEQPAGLLSGGEQQMVAIARALVASPRLLLLDEPSLGLAPIVLRTIFDAFKQLKARGIDDSDRRANGLVGAGNLRSCARAGDRKVRGFRNRGGIDRQSPRDGSLPWRLHLIGPLDQLAHVGERFSPEDIGNNQRPRQPPGPVRTGQKATLLTQRAGRYIGAGSNPVKNRIGERFAPA